MLFYSLSVEFNVDVLVEPDEPDETVPAKNGHDRYMAGALQPALEVFVDA